MVIQKMVIPKDTQFFYQAIICFKAPNCDQTRLKSLFRYGFCGRSKVWFWRKKGTDVTQNENLPCYMVGSNTSKIAFFGERRGQRFLSPMLVSVSGGALALTVFPLHQPGLGLLSGCLPGSCSGAVRLSRGGKVCNFILPKAYAT